jgi:hypothetical protein
LAPNACPYRKAHEWGADGLCLHCYAEQPDTTARPALDAPAWGALWASSKAQLTCTICDEPASMWQVNPFQWTTRCHEHRPRMDSP